MKSLTSKMNESSDIENGFNKVEQAVLRALGFVKHPKEKGVYVRGHGPDKKVIMVAVEHHNYNYRFSSDEPAKPAKTFWELLHYSVGDKVTY